MMTRQQQQQHNHSHQDHQQSKALYELSSMILNIIRYPSSAADDVSRRQMTRQPALSQITPAGFASMLLGISLALMLCGSITFLLGFLLMPWVLGLVMLFYVCGIVSSLTMLGRAVFSLILPPPHTHPRKAAAVPAWKLLIDQEGFFVVQFLKGAEGFFCLGFQVRRQQEGDKVLQDLSTSRFWFKEVYLVVKFDRFEQGFRQMVLFDLFVQGFSVRVLLSSRILSTSLLLGFQFLIRGSALETGLLDFLVAAGGCRQVKVLEFFDCPGLRQVVEDLRELLHKILCLIQCCEGAQGDRETEVFQVSNDDTAVAQRRLEDKQPEEKTNTDCLSGVAKHLGVAGTQQQNGLVDETNVTLFANVRCFLIQSGLSKVFWVEDTTRSTYLVNMSPSSAIGLKKLVDMLRSFGWLASIKQGILEPVKVKCIFLGYHKSIVGNKLWRLDNITSKVLHRFEFEVKPLGDHTFEVEPQENVDQGAGLQEVQTQELMDYQLARDREQHLACELFGYREDSNEAAFVVVAVEKIYAHESLTFNNTVSCEAEIWATKGLLDKAKGNVLGMEVVKNQSGYTLRVSQSRFYNRRSLKANLQDMKTLSTTEAGYMTFTEAWKKKMRLKGLLTESRYELRSECVIHHSMSCLISYWEVNHSTPSSYFNRHVKQQIRLNRALTNPESGPKIRLVDGELKISYCITKVHGDKNLISLQTHNNAALQEKEEQRGKTPLTISTIMYPL
uniref:Transmembrane protein n=1 Tax=Tanacetum cinerariifolium TaxID=118510 RepID=A0A6L2L8A3_TANCI|nr:transmembrane protein [Tanacetum cinerariifolium]